MFRSTNQAKFDIFLTHEFHKFMFLILLLLQAIAFMCGLCYFGTIDLTQTGIQSVQGAIFVIIAENTFGPMYSVLSMFPQDLPLFVRERTSGNYNTVQYYLSHIIALVRILENIHFFCSTFK